MMKAQAELQLKQQAPSASPAPREPKAALDEFLTPMFTELRGEYTTRLADVARTELNRERRADGVAMLAVALKIVDTVEAGWPRP
jgi:hypothetical protein